MSWKIIEQVEGCTAHTNYYKLQSTHRLPHDVVHLLILWISDVQETVDQHLEMFSLFSAALQT